MINYVATVKLVRKERVKGWMGNPKVLLQILWKRRFIDLDVGARSYYTLGGWDDGYGNTMIDTNLYNLMHN